MTASDGPKLRDLDGRWTLDVSGSYGLNVAGFDRYKGWIEKGWDQVKGLGPVLGPLHPVVAENIALLKGVSGMDEVSFHMSGTEAVMAAVRLARFNTRKKLIVCFCGAYHGWWDGVQPGLGSERAISAIQLTVFFGWCYRYGNSSFWPIHSGTLSLVVGGALMVARQILNLSVFYRLSSVGVSCGNRFGYELPWIREFPYSLFKHPQYVGALLSIWGFFVTMRFPHEDWYVIPALESVYYILGAHFEEAPSREDKLVCMSS